MYSESLCKTFVIKYGNWIVNRNSLSRTNTRAANVFFDESHRLLSGFVKSTTTQSVSQSLQPVILKKCDSYQFRQRNLDPSTWGNIYKPIHCTNTNFKSASDGSSSEPYQQESPELRQILSELYKENDKTKCPPNNSDSKGNNFSADIDQWTLHPSILGT